MRIALTLLALLLAWFAPELVSTLEMPLFLGVVITIGMAHGSLDHRLHTASAKRAYSLFLFYTKYLLAVAIVAGIWWLSVPGGVLLFLLSSAYHFGQAEICAEDAGPHKRYRWMRFFWGTALLSVPIVVHSAELVETFQSWQWTVKQGPLQTSGWLVFLGSMIGLLLLSSKSIGQSSSVNSVGSNRHILALLAYSVLLASTPPLWGFTLYFGLWHAWPALVRLGQTLLISKPGEWLLALLPNYLPSLLAMVIWMATATYRPESYTIAGLLVLLSALTVPHTWVFERLYQRRQQQK